MLVEVLAKVVFDARCLSAVYSLVDCVSSSLVKLSTNSTRQLDKSGRV